MSEAHEAIGEQLAQTVIYLHHLVYLATIGAPTGLVEEVELKAVNAFDDLLAMIAGGEPIWRHRSDSERELLERLRQVVRKMPNQN